MIVILTRPTADSDALASELAARGVDTLVAPMLSIVARESSDLDQELDLAQAILVTSANGARALADATHRRDLTLYAVGDATAAVARAAGFGEVESADGDTGDLAALVADRLSPDDGVLLHVSGEHVAGDLETALAERDFAYRRCVLYDAVAAEAMPESAADALKADKVDGVLLFSPRSARTFVELARRAGLTEKLNAVTAYCLSDAVAAVADRDVWRSTIVSARPRSDSLIERVAADLVHRDETPVAAAPSESGPAPHPDTALARPRAWPVIAASMVAAAAVAVVVVLLLRLSPTETVGSTVPADLDARLRSFDESARALADRLSALEARQQSLAALAERVETAEARLATVDSGDAAGLAREAETARSALRREIDQGTQALRAEMSALSNSIDTLAERVDRLERADKRDAGPAAALLLAVGQLRVAALGAGGFASELDAVRMLAPRDPEIAGPVSRLVPWAETGVATEDMLSAGFNDVALAILSADALPEDAGWFETAFAEVKGLVSVRRVGEDVEGDDPQARLARAEARLARNDVAGAVALVEMIEGAEASAGDWLAAARGRRDVSGALDALSAAALVRAGTATPTPTPTP